MPDLTAIAAILTALAAVLIAPLVTYFTTQRQIRANLKTTREQIRANLISANRQAWIDRLRDELAELFELLTWQYLQRPGTYSGEEGYRYEAEKRSRIRLLTNKIRLRLNPLEIDSQALLDLLNKLWDSAAQGSRGEDSEFESLMEKAVAKRQSILKTEWSRVKKGE
jgi:hypothetical protein